MRSMTQMARVSESAATLASLARRLKAASSWRESNIPALWFLTDQERTGDPAAAAARLPAGSGIILRHYQDPNREALAHRLSALARDRDLTLLIGADAGLAQRVKAHGVHMPRWARRT